MELMFLSGLFFLWMLWAAWVMWRQQCTIDRLNDRLMARNYTEYVSLQPKRETPPESQRKPLSWYDEPAIDKDGD